MLDQTTTESVNVNINMPFYTFNERSSVKSTYNIHVFIFETSWQNK